MNRLPTLDPHVLTIADLKEAACRDMPAMYRGWCDVFQFLCTMADQKTDYYNEGAMDLITYALVRDNNKDCH